jgi:hypothetical protein
MNLIRAFKCFVLGGILTCALKLEDGLCVKILHQVKV